MGHHYPDQKVSVYGLDHHRSNIAITVTITGKEYVLEQIMNTYLSHPDGIQGGCSEGLSVDLASSGSGF